MQSKIVNENPSEIGDCEEQSVLKFWGDDTFFSEQFVSIFGDCQSAAIDGTWSVNEDNDILTVIYENEEGEQEENFTISFPDDNTLKMVTYGLEDFEMISTYTKQQ